MIFTKKIVHYHYIKGLKNNKFYYKILKFLFNLSIALFNLSKINKI